MRILACINYDIFSTLNISLKGKHLDIKLRKKIFDFESGETV